MPRARRYVMLAIAGSLSCSPASFARREPDAGTLAAYRQAFAVAAGTRLVAARSREDLLADLAAERILWCGDHHASRALHTLQLDLLLVLAQRRGVRLAFGLEAIGTADEPLVGRYLEGQCTAAEMRRGIAARWRDSWLERDDVEGDFYLALLELAQRSRSPAFALEPTPRPPLAVRDAGMAQRIRAALARWPDRLLVIVVGQAHLLGQGDLVARTGRGGLVLGGEPPAALRTLAPSDARPHQLWQSDAGIWWFAPLLVQQREPGPGTDAHRWSTSSAATR